MIILLFIVPFRDSISDFPNEYKTDGLDGLDGSFENINSNIPHSSG